MQTLNITDHIRDSVHLARQMNISAVGEHRKQQLHINIVVCKKRKKISINTSHNHPDLVQQATSWHGKITYPSFSVK